MQRPIGITLLGCLALLQGLFGLVWPFLMLGAAGFAGAYFGDSLGAALGVLGVLIGVFKLLGPIFHFFLAYGFFAMKSWVWPLGLMLAGLTILGNVGGLMFGGNTIWDFLQSAGVPVVIFAYLLTPTARRALGH